MNKTKRDYELLSAYIDGELSAGEKTALEQKIKSSLELKKKLEDLKKLKQLTTSAYSPLDESPYFETRLFAEINSRKPWYYKIRKWTPAIGFALLTVALLVVLKYNPGIIKNIIEEQKSNIAGFYKENLQPLLYAADLNNEDIFNFALYKQLPLDKNKKEYLLLGNDKTGREYFEIKHKDKNLGKDNFKKFVTALDLNRKQREQIDSILNQYADELKLQVLVNKQNTVAINENLWNYRKAILTDLMSFAEKTSGNEFRRMMPRTVSFTNNPELVSAANKLRMNKSKNYIILTPDSIFSEELDIGKKDVEKGLSELKEKLEKQDKGIKSFSVNIRYDSTWKKFNNKVNWSSNYKITIDTNRCRVDLFDFPSLNMHLPHMDSLSSMLDSLAKHFNNYSYFIPEFEYSGDSLKFHFNGDSSRTYKFKNFGFDIDSLMSSQGILLDSLRSNNWNQFYNFNDSLIWKNFPGFENYFRSFKDRDDIREQMQELKEELRKFREEMKQWKKEFRNPREFKTEKEVNIK